MEPSDEVRVPAGQQVVFGKPIEPAALVDPPLKFSPKVGHSVDGGVDQAW